MKSALPSWSIFPFVLVSLVAHVGLFLYAPAWKASDPVLATQSQQLSVRLVMPPPDTELEPSPEPSPEPIAEPVPALPEAPLPEPVQGPVPKQVQEPLHKPVRRPVFEPPPVIPDAPQLFLEPSPKVAEAPKEEPQADPKPVEASAPALEPRPQAEPLPESPTEDGSQASTEVEPQVGPDEQDEAAIEVDAVPDPAWAPPPEYPRRARARGWQGTVILEVRVDAKGKPQGISIHETSGHEILDEAAVEAVARWKFVPGSVGGRPSETTIRVPVTFRFARD